MEKYGVNDLRRMFLEFFESKDHLKMNSFSLIPHNDKSLLIINSGMAPLKPYFTGQEIPPNKRLTTCQKCIRTGDIENVGKTARHLTFFEMLGNFSFGDYFKEESLKWSWEFLTEVIGMNPERLYPSIYSEDEEAFEIWTQQIGVPAEKITRFYRDENGECDNFWEHGAGPCGPCSEIYYDRGEQYGCGDPDCKVGCECDRFMEVWNNVFTQYSSDGHGNYTELVQKNIDTGMGLERLAVVVQDVGSVYDIDTMVAIRNKICEFSGKEYLAVEKNDVSIRLITDHIRSATFMISDGIMPSNEGRGYVLRRLIRRAARHGKLLAIDYKFMAKLAETVINNSKEAYPELEQKKEMIYKVLNVEESNFYNTIDLGLKILADMQEEMKAEGKTELSGEKAFTLYDTYGFPVDLTQEILEEQNLTIDESGFEAAMNEQREKARNARKETNYMGADATVYEELDTALTSEFVGYDKLVYSSEIIALTTEDEVVEALSEEEVGTIVVKETPFYATMGGQEADKGIIKTDKALFEVKDTIKLPGNKIGHIGTVKSGVFMNGETVTLEVDEALRNDTRKNHSATHLLQKALKIVLGDHVEQQGSFVNENRLRFDFTHFSAMTNEELKKVEDIVNEEISGFTPVVTKVMSIDEAKKSGAMALFGEKYGDVVRVVSMGEFSIELCGGTHVENTGNISSFKIISESGISAGVRRIEALTGKNVLDYYKNIENELNDASKIAKTEPALLAKKVADLLNEIKSLSGENEKLKSKLAKDSLGDVAEQIKEISGINFIATAVKDVDMNGLRNLGDQLKEKVGEGVVVLASSQGSDKVNLITMATDGAIEKGAHAGKLIKEIASLVGGGGGGRPNSAQAGGKNVAGIESALRKAEEVVVAQIK